MSFINNLSTTTRMGSYFVNQILNNPARRIIMNNSYNSMNNSYNRSSQSYRPITGSPTEIVNSNENPESDSNRGTVKYRDPDLVQYLDSDSDSDSDLYEKIPMEIIRKYIKVFPYILLVIIFRKKKKLLIDFPKLEKELSRTISELKLGKINKKSLLKFGIDSSKIRSWLCRTIIYDEVVEDIYGIRADTYIYYHKYLGRCITIKLVDQITNDNITVSFEIYGDGYERCIGEVYDYIERQYLNDTVYIGYLVTENRYRDLTTKIMVSPGKTYEFMTMTTTYKSGFKIYWCESEELIEEINRTHERGLFKVKAQYPDPSIDKKKFCSFRKVSIIEELDPKKFINDLRLGILEVTKKEIKVGKLEVTDSKLEVTDSHPGVFGKIMNLIRRMFTNK